MKSAKLTEEKFKEETNVNPLQIWAHKDDNNER